MNYTRTLKAVAATALLTIPCFSSYAEELPETKISVVGTWSMLPQYKNFEKPFWTEEVSKKSNGAIKADIKGFNEMGLKGSEVVRLMKRGVLDFGSTVVGYLAADSSMNEAIDLAGLSPDIETAHRVSNAYKPNLSKLYEERYGVKLLGIWPYSAQVLFCNTPLQGLKDLYGKKVRTANRTLSEFVGALGGTGVTMSFGEVVQGLQKGVVDCAITGSMSGYSAKWHEVSTHLYALPVGWSHVMHGVSLKAWNKLNPEVRQFISQEINGLEERIWDAAAKETIEGINCNTGTGPCSSGQSANMTLVSVSQQDKDALAQILEDVVLPSWGERCGTSCITDWNNTVGKTVNKRIY